MSAIEVSEFGSMPEGKVMLYTLSNPNGMKVEIINYGAIIKSIYVPDRSGNSVDVVLGFDDLQGYLGDHPYFGAIVGRYGNRIAEGKFSIDEQVFRLAINNGPNHLHGGLKGFDKVLWDRKAGNDQNENATLILSYNSQDGEEGYPGNLNVEVSYSLSGNNELSIMYKASTDKKTHLNLTNHSYFNLSQSASVLDHEIQINAELFTPVDSTLIPTGELRTVANSPFDFRTFRSIGQRIDQDEEQIVYGGGYDHNFVLENPSLSKPSISIRSRDNGITMNIFTTEPGVQFYTGNFLDGSIVGKENKSYIRRSGFCLETQHFPDSPNQSSFPSTLLEPGETYNSTTIFQFGIF